TKPVHITSLTHSCHVSAYNGPAVPPPHELLPMYVLKSTRGLLPFRSVVAMTHWPDAISASTVQEDDSQPLAAIHFACGATPIWFAPGSPSSPTMVPIVCVPCASVSHGMFPEHSWRGSHQL